MGDYFTYQQASTYTFPDGTAIVFPAYHDRRVVDFVGKYTFEKITVSLGERPDHIADRLYDNAALAWVILFVNNMTLADWPKDTREVIRWLDVTYGSRQHDVAYYKDDEGNLWATDIVPEEIVADGETINHWLNRTDVAAQLSNTIANTPEEPWAVSASEDLVIDGGEPLIIYHEISATELPSFQKMNFVPVTIRDHFLAKNEAKRAINVIPPKDIIRFLQDYNNAEVVV